MKNKKTTRRALLSSALSLVLCMAMLIGTTFAWFTDSVTSGRNKIQSGNLDVELYYATTADDVANNNWTKVTSESDIFGYDLWEPGYTKVAYFKVVNKGSLALKYQLTADVYAETKGVNKAGKEFLLSDYIKTALVDTTATRDSILAMNGTELKNSFAMGSDALNAGAEKIVGLAIWMPTTVGNEANHNGTNVPSIEFGINLLATQYTFEKDSFDEFYDDITIVSNATELTDAVNAGKNVMLSKDINMDVTSTAMTVAKDDKVLIDLNGYDIEGTTTVVGATQLLMEVNGELTVTGNGVIAMYDNSVETFNSGVQKSAIAVNGGTLTLDEGVTVYAKSAADAMSYAVDVNSTLGEATLNVNGATLYSSYIAVRVFKNNANKTGIVNFNSGIICGAKKGYDLWTQDPSGNGYSAEINIAAGIAYEYKNEYGGMYYFAEDVKAVSNVAEFKSAIVAGGDVVLATDIDANADETITVPVGTTTNLDLNGKEIVFVTNDADKNDDGKFTSADNEVAIDVRGTLNVQNGKISMEHAGANMGWNASVEVFYVAFDGTLNIENATIEHLGGSDMAFAIDVVNATNTTVNVKNSVIKSAYIAIRVFNNSTGMNYVTITDSSIEGVSRAFWVHIYSNKDNGGRGEKSATLELNIFGNNNTWKASNPNRIIEFGFEDEINFDANGTKL